jgi:hypothetical protein
MVAMGAAKLKQGSNVLHLSLEVRASKIARLYERAAVHKRKADWTDEDSVRGREILAEKGGRLWIMDLSHSKVTPEFVESCVRNVERAHGVKVHCVIIDYLQLMRPARASRERRFEYSELAQEVRASANRMKFDCISGWQINREGSTKDTASETDLAECWDLFMHVDTLIILNRTSAEKSNMIMRLTIAAQREDPDAARTVTAHCDWGTMTLEDNVKATNQRNVGESKAGREQATTAHTAETPASNPGVRLPRVLDRPGSGPDGGGDLPDRAQPGE